MKLLVMRAEGGGRQGTGNVTEGASDKYKCEVSGFDLARDRTGDLPYEKRVLYHCIQLQHCFMRADVLFLWPCLDTRSYKYHF